MGAETKVKLTYEEGNFLLQLSAGFAMAEKVGDKSFTIPDRAVITDEVHALYLILKSYSPMMSTPERWRLFGPADNYEEKVDPESKQKCHPMKDFKREVEVRLDDEALSGMAWCIFCAVCPGEKEKNAVPVQGQSEILWPIAAKIDRTKDIRELVGYSKGTPRRWKSDGDYAKEEKKSEAVEKSKPVEKSKEDKE